MSGSPHPIAQISRLVKRITFNPSDSKTFVLSASLSIRVAIEMAIPIHFDHQSKVRAVEIHDVLVDGALAQEAGGVSAEVVVPQVFFGGGHVGAKCAGFFFQGRVVGEEEFGLDQFGHGLIVYDEWESPCIPLCKGDNSNPIVRGTRAYESPGITLSKGDKKPKSPSIPLSKGDQIHQPPLSRGVGGI